MTKAILITKMKRKLLLLLALFALSSSAFAETKSIKKHITVELISEKASVKSGEDLDVGIKFNLDPEWHVYWQNPGDSGEAPRIAWALPRDIKAGPINWPPPEKIIVGPLADYGYANEVLLISTLKIPEFVSEKPFEIKAKVKWLVCREVCIPGNADLELILPITNSEPIMTSYHELFESTRNSFPVSTPKEWKINTSSLRKTFKIRISGPENIKEAYFFPLQQLQIDNFSKQELSGNELVVKKNDQLSDDPKSMDGVLKINGKSYNIKSPVVVSVDSTPLWIMILFAFLGGLILNLMPCVFPVLSMKVFGFLKNIGEEKEKIRAHAKAYMLGILVSFWILVAVLLALKSGGQHLGWGFQLQSPPFVASLAAILFLFGLNLVGVFEVGGSIMGVGQSLTRKEGFVGDFFTGVLATVVSTPCTAPFMGSAVGFALSQNIFVTFVIFTFLALGLGAPYVILAYNPTMGRILPRPGPWMETLKQITAFLIFATVVWLISVVALQAPISYVVILMGSLFLMGLAAWILHRWSEEAKGRYIALFIILAALFFIIAKHEDPQNALVWEDFSPSKVEVFKSNRRAVFVDFTAAWCISCKVNELVVFNSTEVKEKLRSHNVALLKADWTSQDPVITQSLADLGRSGVPTYVIFQPEKDPILLPEVITPGIVINALDNLK
jgi:thiol:disulfide interchange protein